MQHPVHHQGFVWLPGRVLLLAVIAAFLLTCGAD